MIRDKELVSLAQLWVKGVVIDWNMLYSEENSPNKINLPVYPFARERYWITKSKTTGLSDGIGKLHPLLHQNSSNMEEQKFTSIYSGKESFLSEHIVRGEKILPGVAYLELVREAGVQSLNQPVTQLKAVKWLDPIRVNGESKQIQISLFEDEGAIGYEVYSQSDDNQEIIHSQGKLSTEPLPMLPKVDLAQVKSRLTHQKAGKEYYEWFKSWGLNLGRSFQGMETLYFSGEEALNKIRLDIKPDYVLQPGLMDSALHTCLGLNFIGESTVLNLPYSVGEVNIYGDVSKTRWCYARNSQSGRGYDIDLLSDKGDVLLRFVDFIALPVAGIQDTNRT